MKKKLINWSQVIISLGLFILTIVLTNDEVKEKIQNDKITPAIPVILMMLIVVVLIRRNKVKYK